MNILHVSCSPRGSSSESLRLSEEIVEHLRGVHADAKVVHRVVGGDAGLVAPIEDP